ncbi:hypothetical protein MKK69_10480 [Methylobacterium sp. J-026]|uniref:hypothetical protein n=1 Tax=Methylobacterium sp. J-026 TaxID=2836624 RepID=UPI001FB998CB|nr:hypothetical protein [Methylobacterium sp. J-026]MCJ2134473.1 hypothetical protein [Methylobacterium sp. J-026]
MELVKKNFDPYFYLIKNPDVKKSGLDPFTHFLQNGASELRDPNSGFSTAAHMKAHKDAIPDGMHPFVYYLTALRGETTIDDLKSQVKEIEHYFDRDFYLGQNSDVSQADFGPEEHYLLHGQAEGRDPSASFATRWYRAQYMVGEPAALNPMLHLIRYGMDRVYPARLVVSDEELVALEAGFDADFYRRSYLDPSETSIEPIRHYLTIGWLLGFDPNPNFSTWFYLKIYRSRLKVGTNPFVHYMLQGKQENYVSSHRLSEAERLPELFEAFDPDFYLRCHPEIRTVGLDPFEHYMLIGWKDGWDPNAEFSTIFYARAYADVTESGLAPFLHYVKHGQQRVAKSRRPYLEVAPGIDRFSTDQIFARYQDMTFPLHLETTKRLIVMVVPQHDAMSGGIFSMFSIAKTLRSLKREHGYDVVVMTAPNLEGATYARQTNFRNDENVFRFDQLTYCQGVEELYIHIPEYTAPGFIDRYSGDVIRYLSSRKRLYINLLNQNIELMPDASTFVALRRFADELSQSVAHHAYFNQAEADRRNLPTLLLPAYTDLRGYRKIPAKHKSELMIYSLDDAIYKTSCLKRVREAFPHCQLIEVRGMPFDHYMELATRCRFSISFGEGFDGYVAQPIFQGGIGITIFRKEFFPSEDFLRFPNFFESAEALIDGIVPLMTRLGRDCAAYDRLNHALVAEYDKLYSLEDYERRVSMLAERKFEIFPRRMV